MARTEPKWPSSAFLRLAPTPATRSSAERPTPLPRLARWLVIAKRCASSRSRCKKYRTGSRWSSLKGGRPGRCSVSRPASRSGPLAIASTGSPEIPQPAEGLERGAELTGAAVDDHQIRPLAALAIGILALQPGEAATQDFAHHGIVVTGREILAPDQKPPIARLGQALGSGDDERAERIRAHDVAVVVDLDAAWRFRQAEPVGELAEEPGLGAALGELARQRVAGVLFRLLDQLALFAALRAQQRRPCGPRAPPAPRSAAAARPGLWLRGSASAGCARRRTGRGTRPATPAPRRRARDSGSMPGCRSCGPPR